MKRVDQNFLNKAIIEKRGLIGKKSLKFLNFISSYEKLKIHAIPSGTKCFDWTIPDEWILDHAFIKKNNEKILSVSDDNILNIVNGSISIDKTLTYDELKENISYKKDLDCAIPWMHSYYGKNWGFCLKYEDFEKLDKAATYHVNIKSTFKKSNLYIGELFLQGSSDSEIVLMTYTCHPSMANDNLSGIALLLDLFYRLRDVKDRKYSYRFLFLPETIGSIAALSQGIINKNNVEYALVLTCVGHGEIINYKKTFTNNHTLDFVVEDVLSQSQCDFICRDYWPTGGSDERQLSSPSIRIPTGTLMRSPYGEYKEYHTSNDDIDLIDLNLILKMSDIHFEVILKYETCRFYKCTTLGGEPFLTKYGNYRTLGGTHTIDNYEKIVKWLCFLGDGNNSLIDVSFKSQHNLDKIMLVYYDLLKHDILVEL